MKKFSNSAKIKASYEGLLTDTTTAIENIESCLNSESEMDARLNRIKCGDVSAFDDILGIQPSGQNGSRYRSYFTLDKESVIEIRISNHLEPRKTDLMESDKMSSFLLQIALVTNPLPSQTNDAVTINMRSVDNLKVLSKKLITSNISLIGLSNTLRSIHDYLIKPYQSEEFANI